SAGQFLPPTNQLAEQLQLNRNTINRVYSKLRDEGFVSLQKGRGTQVIDSLETNDLRTKSHHLFSYIQKIHHEANEHGYDLKDILIPAYAYTQLFQSQYQSLQHRLPFILSKEEDYSFYQAEIERLAEREVDLIFIED